MNMSASVAELSSLVGFVREPETEAGVKVAPPASAPVPVKRVASLSPGRRVWLRFRSHRLGYASLLVFLGLYLASLLGEFISNDRPLLVRYEQQWYFPLFHGYPETTFGGTLSINADYLDPVIQENLARPGNFVLYPLNRFYYDTLNYHTTQPHFPAPSTRENWLGTDIAGYDLTARVLYGFRSSVTFAIALTTVCTLFGILIGALQGYYAGKVDLFTQRLIEILVSMPELYLLIIFASMFDHSFVLLFGVLALFGWTMLSDYVRAEVLRNRQQEYVKAARAMGLSNWQIIRRHILPNSLTPVITFLPFRMSAAIMALASLDFLGLGVTAPAPSLGQLLAQGKSNLDAWWITAAAFATLTLTILLLTFMGDALRNSLDNRISDRQLATGGL
jgi:microcin C transport system permease protein